MLSLFLLVQTVSQALESSSRMFHRIARFRTIS